MALHSVYKEIRSLLSIIHVSLSPEKRTLYPTASRKSKFKIFTDLLSWYWKYREVNHRYFLYGMDREGFDCHRSHIGHRKFRLIRDEMNKAPSFCNNGIPDYLAIIRDKFVFSRFMKSCGIPVADDLALIDRKVIKWIPSGKTELTSEYLSSDITSGEFFCKLIDGGKGKNAFLLNKKSKHLRINKKTVSIESLLNKLSGKWVLQEKIVQHQDLNLLYPESVNTVRVISVNTGSSVIIFSAILRTGTGGRNVDNYSAGGVVLGVDVINGSVTEYGIHNIVSGPKIVKKHPDTLVNFTEFEIPMITEVCEVIKNAHSWLYGIKTIGWDVAITNKGPVLLEANDQWDGETIMLFKKEFKKEFLQHHNQKV